MTFVENESSIKEGTISLWVGNTADIPDGWVVCDGNNGSPDLLNDYVNSPSDYSSGAGATGGSSSKTLSTSQIPSHNQDPVSVDSAGNHNHTFPDTDNGQTSSNTFGDYCNIPESSVDSVNVETDTDGTSTNGAHSHSSSTLADTGSANSINMNPSYTEVAYIYKV